MFVAAEGADHFGVGLFVADRLFGGYLHFRNKYVIIPRLTVS